jgi:hypothetical protein
MCADTALIAGTICGLAHYNTPETKNQLKMLSRAAKTIPALKIDQVI